MSKRIQLNDQDVEKVVGGAFNWYYDEQGARYCWVDGVGDFSVILEAKDRYAALKLAHKLDGWTAQMYVDVLVQEGYFRPY